MSDTLTYSPTTAVALDELARWAAGGSSGRREPGFPDGRDAVLSLSTRGLARVSVTRSLDLRPPRAHRLTRFGLGESPETFEALCAEQVHGHIGR